MQTIELFSGTEIFSSVARKLGRRAVDNDNTVAPDLCADMVHVSANQLPAHPDIIWASPPREAFSVAAIGRIRHRNGMPKTRRARLAIAVVTRTRAIIAATQPAWCFIENPRGMLRRMALVQGLTRHTITYCEYGNSRMKPTDIWTNTPWWKPQRTCKKVDPCHVPAPHGSRTETKGLRSSRERGRLPPALFEEICGHPAICHWILPSIGRRLPKPFAFRAGRAASAL